MSNPGTVALANLSLRWLMQRDLPRVLEIQEQSPQPGWSQQDFLTVLQSFDTTGWVAEVDDQLAGFLIYMISSPGEGTEDVAHRIVQRPHWEGSQGNGKQISISILNLGIAAQWQRQGLGRNLLSRLCRKLRHPEDSIQAIVPESNLPMQLLLRDAKFKATQIARGYYGNDDAYLMERKGPAPRLLSGGK